MNTVQITRKKQHCLPFVRHVRHLADNCQTFGRQNTAFYPKKSHLSDVWQTKQQNRRPDVTSQFSGLTACFVACFLKCYVVTTGVVLKSEARNGSAASRRVWEKTQSKKQPMVIQLSDNKKALSFLSALCLQPCISENLILKNCKFRARNFALTNV